MNANEPAAAFQNQPSPRFGPPERAITLKSEQVQIGCQSFLFMLKENSRGRFLQMTEKTAEGLYGLAMPNAALEAFQMLLDGMVRAADERPPASPPFQAEQTLKTSQMQFEHVHQGFLLLLTESAAGRVLQIIKKRGLPHQHLVIPAGGLEAFQRVTNEMIRAAAALPPPSALPPRTLVSEHIFKSVTMPVETKSFMLVLKENPRGRYLRITEKTARRFNCVIIAAAGFAAFQQRLGEMVAAARRRPPTTAAAKTPKPPLTECIHASAQMQINDKQFLFLVKENACGRFLRLIEESPDHPPQNLIIPASGLKQLKQQVDELIALSDQHPVARVEG